MSMAPVDTSQDLNPTSYFNRTFNWSGTDPDGWYCYTAIEFVGDHVLLAHCEFPRLNSLQVTRLHVGWLYESSSKGNERTASEED